MVRKLFKHEIFAYLRVWLPMQIILISVAFFTRLIQVFESDSTIYDIVSGSSGFLYTIAVIASIALVAVFAISRFYKNLFSHEGYLSFTLPVTPAQHILAKSVTAGLFSVLTAVTVFISVMVVSAGDVFVEIMKALGYTLDKIYELAGYHIVFYMLEALVIIFISVICTFLFYYSCISLGQLFKKNRVIGAVGVYFIYQTAMQILSTFTVAVVSQIEFDIDAIAEFVRKHIYAMIHAGLCGMIVIELILAAVYFLVSHTVMRKKLNLE